MLTTFFTRRALAGLFAGALLVLSCPAGGGGGEEEAPNVQPDAAGGGSVVFDNTDGICPARVYASARRTADDLLAEVARGARSEPVAYPASPHGATFYFSYTTFIDDVPLTYIPRPPDGIQSVRVDTGATTRAVVPPVDTTIASLNTPLVDGAYLVIRNTSAFSFFLVKGSMILKPENYKAAQSETSYIVNSGEAAVYILAGGDSGRVYSLNITTGINRTLEAAVPAFASGHIYDVTLNGASAAALSAQLASEKSITLANVSMAQGANKDFSFTTWRDTTTDADGALLAGDNTIEFYANSARLDGAYWKHPNGSYNYSGQILEAKYRDDLSAVVIWTKKAENKGFLLKKDEGGALLLDGAPVRHPFFEQ